MQRYRMPKSEEHECGIMLLKGFRLGMLLQIAVGPVCAFIFQAAAADGFWPAEEGVAGVVLADAFYIFAALLGVGTLLDRKPGLRCALKYGGAALMALFGIWLLMGAAFPGMLPVFRPATRVGMFAGALLLTLSSPLTIVFWAGVFAQRAAEQSVTRRGLMLYGLGAVLSTLVFLTAIAALGGILRGFLQDTAVRVLNGVVGAVVVGFGVRAAVKRENKKPGNDNRL